MRMRQVEPRAAAGRADQLRLPAGRPAGQVAVAGRDRHRRLRRRPDQGDPSRSAPPRSRRCTASRRTARSPTRLPAVRHQGDGRRGAPARDQGRSRGRSTTRPTMKQADRQRRRRHDHRLPGPAARRSLGRPRLRAADGVRRSRQSEPLPPAHAHNDYEHRRPLQDALDRGFNSVEADVWLVDGELLRRPRPGRGGAGPHAGEPVPLSRSRRAGQDERRAGTTEHGTATSSCSSTSRATGRDLRGDRPGAARVPRHQHDRSSTADTDRRGHVGDQRQPDRSTY